MPARPLSTVTALVDRYHEIARTADRPGIDERMRDYVRRVEDFFTARHARAGLGQVYLKFPLRKLTDCVRVAVRVRPAVDCVLVPVVGCLGYYRLTAFHAASSDDVDDHRCGPLVVTACRCTIDVAPQVPPVVYVSAEPLTSFRYAHPAEYHSALPALVVALEADLLARELV